LLAIAIAACSVTAAQAPEITKAAPTAHVSGTQFEAAITTSALNLPSSIAIDGAGNLYIVDSFNGRLLKETPTQGGYNETVISTTFGDNSPFAVALDKSGNVYVTQLFSATVNGVVYEEKLDFNATTGVTKYQEEVIPTAGLVNPEGIAVDSNDNVFVSDTGNNRIVELVLSHGTWNQSTLFSTGLNKPAGIVLDSQDNFYIADYGSSEIIEEKRAGSSFTQKILISTGLLNPTSVAFDQGGLVIADTGSNRVVKESPATGGTYTESVLSTSKLSGPQGVAVDGFGHVFIVDTINNRVVEELSSGSSVDFGASPVGKATAAATITFTIDTAGTLGAPVLKTEEGAASFVSSGGSCAKGAFLTAAKTCTLLIKFKPATGGVVFGDVELTGLSGQLVTTAALQGVGAGPRLIFPSINTQTIVAGSLDEPYGVAVDIAGNVYVADYKNNKVYMEAPSGATYKSTSIGTGLKEPTWVAVDIAGNVFISDSGNDRILEESPGSRGYTQSQVETAGVNKSIPVLPGPLAVDHDGNLYVGTTGLVNKYQPASRGDWKLDGGTAVAYRNPVSGKITQLLPNAISLDAGRNIYVAAKLGTVSMLLMYTPSPGGDYSQTTIGDLVAAAGGIAVDRFENVYVTEGGDENVYTPAPTFHTAGTVGSPSPYTLISLANGGLATAHGIAVDFNGNVYIANSVASGTSDLLRESYSQGSALLVFPTTVIEANSNPKSIEVLNLGNDRLPIPVPKTGSNPTIGADFTLNSSADTACPIVTSSASEPGSIPLGKFCDFTVSFVPQAAKTYSQDLELLNAAGHEVLTIGLQGKGTLPSPVISWPTPAAIPYSTALSSTQLDATASYNSSPVSGTFVYTPTLGTVLGGGAQTLKVTFTPTDTAAFNPVSASVRLEVTPAMLTVFADTLTRPYGSPNPTLTASFLGFINGDTAATALTGSPILSTVATQQFPWGYYAIDIAQGTLVSQNYSFQFVPGTLYVTQAPLTITANNVSINVGDSLPAFSYTPTGFVNGDTLAVLSGAPLETTTATDSNTPGTFPIDISLGTLSALNYTFVFVDGTLTISSAMSKPRLTAHAAAERPRIPRN
jgi:sugar lactone lactonase YvrE